MPPTRRADSPAPSQTGPRHRDEHGTTAAVAEPLAAYRAWLTQTAGLAESTSRTYSSHAADYHAWWATTRHDRDPATAEPDDVEAYLGALARRGCRAATRRTALHALRSYYRWLGRHTQAPAGTAAPSGTSPVANPAAQVRRPRVRSNGRIPIYTETEAAAILTAAGHTTPEAPRRTRPDTGNGNPESAELGHGSQQGAGLAGLAVLATLRWAGLRAGELCALTCTHVDLDQHRLHVLGKGSKHRALPIAPPLLRVLQAYQHHRPLLAARYPEASDRFFLNPRSRTGAYTNRSLFELCRRTGTAAGVPGPHGPLRWRHTFATLTLARDGIDIHTVSRLLGHARLSTTERYLNLATDDLAHALTRAYP